MPHKRVLRPERLRQVPPQFSWIDQRLVRDRHLERCDVQALALYLVLVTVADAQGLSYYGEASLTRLLSMPAAAPRSVMTAVSVTEASRAPPEELPLDPPAAARVHGMHSVEHGLTQLRATLAVPADRDRRG